MKISTVRKYFFITQNINDFIYRDISVLRTDIKTHQKNIATVLKIL